MKDALRKLFEEYGYQGEWADAYRNYRLKGSQVDFDDGEGRPLLLGNSVTESGFVPNRVVHDLPCPRGGECGRS